MKWKSLSRVQLFATPWTTQSMEFSRPETGVGSLSLLQDIFLTQGSNPGFPHCRRILYQLSHKRSPRILERVAYPFSSGSSWPRNQTGASCIAGRFFTSWAIWLEVYKLHSAFQRNSFDFISFYLSVFLFSIFFLPLWSLLLLFLLLIYMLLNTWGEPSTNLWRFLS